MERFQTADGAILAYTDEGEGTPLLALAGLTRDGRDFDYLQRRLHDRVRLIRLDSCGRGHSSWTGPHTYTVAQEASDMVALLDHLGLQQAAVIGSSRGGLLGMALAATHKPRLLGVCLNDVGPVLERAGLERMSTYVGVAPTVNTLEKIADRMPLVMPGFSQVPEMRWVEETLRHYVQLDGRVGLPYDPALRTALQTAFKAPPSDAWRFFEACAGLPVALIRGEHSDVLSTGTAQEMRRRRPDMHFATVLHRGHVPFLDEPEALQCIQAWLKDVAACRTAVVQAS
jgi:pimeloyl-ACP methyl ester carboxylesterase